MAHGARDARPLWPSIARASRTLNSELLSLVAAKSSVDFIGGPVVDAALPLGLDSVDERDSVATSLRYFRVGQQG
eukprot:scaffold7676_cov258-Pinguiococcus_pyrenoidosus.AAC.8